MIRPTIADNMSATKCWGTATASSQHWFCIFRYAMLRVVDDRTGNAACTVENTQHLSPRCAMGAGKGVLMMLFASVAPLSIIIAQDVTRRMPPSCAIKITMKRLPLPCQPPSSPGRNSRNTYVARGNTRYVIAVNWAGLKSRNYSSRANQRNGFSRGDMPDNKTVVEQCGCECEVPGCASWRVIAVSTTKETSHDIVPAPKMVLDCYYCQDIKEAGWRCYVRPFNPSVQHQIMIQNRQ